VDIQSQINAGLASYPYEQGVSSNMCPAAGAMVFCAPAPPGPDKVVVTATGTTSNETWLSVPWVCCSHQDGPLLLNATTDPSISSVNMSSLATVNSTVVVAGGSEPISFAAATACPASPSSDAPCGESYSNQTGGLHITDVPLGWDVLHASANGYAPNSEWFYTASPNVTLAPLPLTPLGLLEGYVVSSNGSAIIDASIDACTLASAISSRACSTELGSGVTTSGGYYQGLIGGGWLPGATYEIEASAPGYLGDWTWANVTANATTMVPTITLQSVGNSINPGSRGSPHPFTVVNPAGTWVNARIVDNSTGFGVQTQLVTACAVIATGINGVCNSITQSTNTGGYLNDSMATGVYNLTVDPTGYLPVTVLLTVPAGVPTVNAGTILVTPLNWIFGMVQDNWTTTEVNYTVGQTVHTTYILFAPPANVFACGLYCGTATPDGTSGDFQTQTSPGLTDFLEANPSYTGSFTSAAGGYNPMRVTFVDEVPLLNITPNVILVLYVSVSGTVYNAASCPPLGNESYCTDPARWASVQVATNGVNNGVATAMATGGGHYITFLPGDNDQGATKVTAFDAGFYFTQDEVLNAQLGAYPGFNLSYVAPALQLTQFGYAYANVIDQSSGLPAVGVGLSSQFSDPINGNAGSTTGTTNGAGFVNITAPSGDHVGFSVGGTNGYNNTSLSAPVPIGNATSLDVVYSVGGGPVEIPPWGWAESTFVNFSAALGYFGTVVDKTTGQPLPGATVAVTDPDPLIGAGGSTDATNSLGEFLADAPIGPRDSLVVSLPAYEINTTVPLNITPGAFHLSNRINLTGFGVLASTVVSEPSGLPVSGATVTACEGTSANGIGLDCAETSTNASGAYWIDVAPGHITVVVNATGFVANYSEVVAATSDTWTHIPDFQLVEDGVLLGTVRGLPTGLAVSGAQVSACSPLGGTPTGPCSFTVNALNNGSFTLPVVPSQYILATSAPGYNASYLPVSVQPGETVDLGIIPLNEYGILTGTVIDNATGAPVANAQVGGCPLDSLLPCLVPTLTNLTGVYSIAAPPGAVVLVVSTPGFLDGYLSTSAVSGLTTYEPRIAIAPEQYESSLQVRGTVVASNDSSVPISSATVGLWSGLALAVSTDVGPGGAFALTVPTGTYTLEVTAPGYAESAQTLVVDEDVSGLVVALSIFGWTVSGTVEDGLTHAPLAGVAIWSASALLGVSSSSGVYALSLPNGTYPLTAILGGTSGSMYAPVPFEVQVAAAAVTGRTVLLYPPSATLAGVVENAANGTPIGVAHVAIVGLTVDGYLFSSPATTSASGQFSVAAYSGSYNVTVSAPGYHTATVGLVAGVSTPALTIELTPLASSSGTSAMTSELVALGLLVLIGAVAVVIVVAARKKSGAPP
jgi:hypothetical protein